MRQKYKNHEIREKKILCLEKIVFFSQIISLYNRAINSQLGKFSINKNPNTFITRQE